MNAHTDGRTSGAAQRPLSPLQIKKLIPLARQAFEHLIETGALGDAAEFDAWRHAQCLQTVERGGFREARNEDYLPLTAHFLRLLGRDSEADTALARYEVEPRTWAWSKLQEAFESAADVLPQAKAYAAGYLRNKRSISLEDASDKDLWSCVYLVTRRAEQLRKKGVAT